MAEIWSLYGTVSLKGFDIATRQLRQLESQAKQAGSTMASRFENLALAAKGLSDKLTMIGAPLTFVGGMALKTAADFEMGMKDAGAVMRATAREMDEMAEAARRLAPELGFAPSEAARAFYLLASSGLKAKESIQALPGILELARATSSDLGLAAEATIGTLTMFGMEMGNTRKVADVFVRAIGNSMAEMQKLAYSMRYAGPVAASLGWNIEELVATLGLLYNAGYQGEQAGTVLRGALSRLLDPSKETREAIEALGLSFGDLDPRTRSMVEILEALERANMTAADAVRIFGQEAGPGMIALVGQGSQALRNLEAALRDTGMTARSVAEEQMDAFGRQVARLRGELQALATEIAEDPMKDMTDRLRELNERLRETPEPLKDFLGKLGLMGVGATGAIFAFRGLTWMGKSAAEMFGALGAGANHLGSLLLAIGPTLFRVQRGMADAAGETKAMHTETLGLAAGLTALILAIKESSRVIPVLDEAIMNLRYSVKRAAWPPLAEEIRAAREMQLAARELAQDYARLRPYFELEEKRFAAWQKSSAAAERERIRQEEARWRAEEEAQKAAAARERAVSSLVSAITSAMSEVASASGEASEAARARLTAALEEVALYARKVGATGIVREIEAAMGSVEQVVSDSSGEAARAMLEALQRASEAAGKLVKEGADESALSMKTSFARAAAELADRVRKEMKRAAEEARRNAIRAIDDLHSALVGALRRRYEEQRGIEVEALQESIERERQRTEKTIQEIDKRTRARVDALRAELEALSEEDKLAERERAREEHERKLQELAEERRYHELRTGREHEEAIAEIDKQIAEENRKWEELQQQWALEDRRRAIEEEIRQAEEQAEAEKEQAREKMESAIEKKQKELDYLQNEFYPRLLNEASLAAEAEKMILANKHAEILKLLKQYGEGWKDLGVTFGQRLLEGLGPYTAELSRWVSEALSAVTSAKAPAATTTAARTAGTAAGKKALTPAEASVQARYEEELVRRLGVEGAKEWLKTYPTPGAAIVGGRYYEFHAGGVVPQVRLPEWLRRALDLGPSEIPIVAEAGEVVLPRSIAGRIAGSTMLPGTGLEAAFDRAARRFFEELGRKMGAPIGKVVGAEHVHIEDEMDVDLFAREIARRVVTASLAGGR